MPAVFKTFGPFEVEAEADSSLRHIWHTEPGLRYGYGLYIIAERNGSRYTPWYVGKTDRTFGSRLSRHRALLDVSQRSHGGPVHLFVIARVTPTYGKIARSKVRRVEHGDDFKVQRKKSKLIDRLEYALIETCLGVNPNLLNVQLRKLQQGVLIPGYLGEWTAESLDKSAQALQSLLRA